MKLSRDGYKRNSKDVNNPYNVIPSGDITMKGVDFPVMGTDNLGNQQVMQPGFDYKFPGNMVFEQPVQDKPKNQVKQRRVDRDNKLLPNWTKEMGDISSHLMTTMQFTDDDGSPIYIAIPMLYPTTEGQETPDPASWTQFAKGDEMSAFEMAMDRGEVYYFSSAEEANAFAKGGYKTPNLKKRDGGSLPKAQFQWMDDAYQWGKSLFSKPTTGLQYPKGGLTHKFTNAPKFPIKEGRASDHFGLLRNFDYTSFPDWQRYIAASQPLTSSYQFPTLVNDAAFNNLINNKNLINVNSLNQYLDKTKGLNSMQLYDRQRIKTVFDDLNLSDQKYIDKDLFLGEVNKTLNPQLTIPSLTSLPMKTGTDYSDYWMGESNPHKTFSLMANMNEFTPTNWDNMSIMAQKNWMAQNYPKLSTSIVSPNTDPHVLQTFIPNSPGVPMYDRSVGSSHFNPMVNDSYEGGLTLGHNRISFDPAFPKTTISMERQSDYAQRYNVKNSSGVGSFDEYLSVLKDTKPLQTELAIEKSKTNLDNTTKFIEEIDKGDDAIRKLLHSEAQVEHWTGRTFHEVIKNFYNGRDFRPRHTARGLGEVNYKINNNDLSFDATHLNFNELTHAQMIEIVNSPQFKNYIKENKKYFKSQYDENVIKHKKQVAKNEKEIYDIENWNPLKTKLENYKKNAPVILLNELIDYSTKIGNTHVHIPLSSTVAKTQGYDANKWGAPNPLFHEFKWTGHDWNTFNKTIKDAWDSGTSIEATANEKLFNIGPFNFDATGKSGKMFVNYTNPNTGKVTSIKGANNQEVLTKIETIRNEFLTSKGYNPEVDYKSAVGSYKPEHQTILNKSTETQLKKDIEQIFGKDYPYEIIKDNRGNQYIRLDHTGTRLPIKNIHKYKSGGESLPKAQYKLVDKMATVLGNANKYKNILPKPTVKNLTFNEMYPMQKLLSFDQTNQIIPQQHMVNADRGEFALTDAIDDIYSDKPMWFAPIGDDRYFNESLSQFGKVDPDLLNFIPGQGRHIIRYIRDQKGNTGKWGFNEYPLTDAEKLTKMNQGFWDAEKTQPILRTEQITVPDFQSKITGIFSPDIKFKLFDDIDLSTRGHAMHKVWSPEELQLIKDEGYDAIQLTKDGVQLENILLNKEKFKIKTINDMPVHIENPPFKIGGSLPKAQFQQVSRILNTGKGTSSLTKKVANHVNNPALFKQIYNFNINPDVGQRNIWELNEPYLLPFSDNSWRAALDQTRQVLGSKLPSLSGSLDETRTYQLLDKNDKFMQMLKDPTYYPDIRKLSELLKVKSGDGKAELNDAWWRLSDEARPLEGIYSPVISEFWDIVSKVPYSNNRDIEDMFAAYISRLPETHQINLGILDIKKPKTKGAGDQLNLFEKPELSFEQWRKNLQQKQAGGSLPKAQFNNIEAENEAEAYMKNYLYSDLFKRRVEDVHGEENYKDVYRAKMDALNNVTMNATDPERWRQIFDNPVTLLNFQRNLNESEKLQATYRGKNNEITYNTEQALDAIDNSNLSYNPLSSMIVNEYTHALGAMGSDRYFPFIMTEREKEIARKRKEGANPDDHDKRAWEVKSDIETTRFELYKNNLYNLNNKNFKFDKSHIKFIKDNPDKFIKDKNLFDNYDDDVILEMMNTFTDNSSMPLGMSKYGGQLPKAQDSIELPIYDPQHPLYYNNIIPADNTGSGFPGGNYNYFNPLDFQQTFNTDVPIAWENVPQDVKDKWESGREFMQMWYTSPMGIQMMKNSDPENWEQLQAARLENINKDYSDINFYYNNVNDPTLWAWAGGKHGTHNVGVYPRAFYAGPSAAHEFAHISHNENTWKDRFKDTHWDTDVLGEIPINKSFFKSYGPESNWFNPMQEGLAAGNYQGFGDFGGHTYKWDKEHDEFLLIPQTDMNLMYASDLSYNDHRGPHSRLGNINQSDSEYWGEASEHIARLNAIRYKAYHTRDEHGWDPLTMPLTAELWEKVKKVIPSVGGDDDFNAIEQLGSIIGDDATRKHLNLISDASDQTGNVNMKTAKFGGQLPKAQLQLINEGEKLINYGTNIINKGKQIIPRLKKAYDLNKYNKSTDIFGNTGYDLAADLTPNILQNKSLIDFKALANTTINDDRLHQLIADYTIDSSPFKFGTFKDIDGNTLENLVQPLSVIKGPNGEVINATDNKFALELSDYIKNNRLNWKNSTDGELNKPLSLTRMWNENESLSGTHGNINDLKLSLESGEPIQLGDVTSWSAGKAGLNAFGQHRYVIKDFDFETPALLNEYNKYLSKNQQNVWKEREILLGPDTKFTVKNIIDNAPRKPHWDLYTNLKETNPKLWEDLGFNAPNTNLGWQDKAGAYSFKNDPTLKVWPNGQINPNYDKIQTLIQNDPTFKVKAIPNYGTDVELELLKKLYGGSLNSLPKAQIQDEILNANIKADKWNKEYVQSENYMSMLKRAKEKESVINSRIAEAMNFDPYKHITYDENNYSLGQYYNSGSHLSDGSQYPISTFMHGEAMLNYNPTLFPNHPAYNNPGISTGGWPALAGHELIGHYGVDKLNRKQRKALNSLINWEALDNFAGDSNEAYDHGKDPYEMRANLAQLRYQLDNAGIYDSKKGLAVTADGEEGDNPFTEEHLKQILEFDEDGTFIRIKPEFNNEILQFVAPQDIIWMMNNIAQNQEIGDDLPEGIIRAKMGAELTKFQEKGANDPNWLAQRLYNSVTPIGYNIDHALKEMYHGSRQPFMWDGVETSFDDFENHPRFQEQYLFPGQGNYIKNASQDLWGMYLGFDQKNNTLSKSKFKPTKGVEDSDAIYYSFNDVRDIWADITDDHHNNGVSIISDITKDKWQINDSGAGGFNLASYQISKGEDREKELPYFAYYDEYDFDIPTGLGFDIPGEKIVGNPFEIYGRIYYNPETMEMIPQNEVKGWWVDLEKLKQGVGYAESLDGELMINPESTATGRYGQRFSEINDVYEGTRTQFANDLEAQEKYFEDRYRGRMEGIPGLKESAIELYQEYNKQIESFPYSTTEVAALVNFLGRQGTREYLGYVLRDGNSLESVFPDKYGPNAGQSNKTPQQYIDKFNEGITNMKKQHVEDDLTGRLIRKLDRGEELTPAGTKHLESLGMI